MKAVWESTKPLWANWNDQLSLIVILGVPCLWVATHWISIPGEVVGASIGGWTLTLQFYFRKKKNGEEPIT